MYEADNFQGNANLYNLDVTVCYFYVIAKNLKFEPPAFVAALYRGSPHSVHIRSKNFSKLHYMKPIKKLHYVSLDSHSVDFIREDSH